MDNNNRILDHSQQDRSAAMAKTFLASVFSWMFLALMITGGIAYYVGTNEDLIMSIFTTTNAAGQTKVSILGYAIMFSPLIFSLIFGFIVNRLPYILVMILFLAFSGLMGLSLSTIFLAYEIGSIYLTFGICAGMFGLMALVGYATKTDLARLGPILGMGVIGIVICSVIYMFTGGEQFNILIGFFGVIVFTALTAYEVQQLKRIGAGMEYQGVDPNKLSIIGAFQLYITFINLFISLLRLFGEKK